MATHLTVSEEAALAALDQTFTHNPEHSVPKVLGRLVRRLLAEREGDKADAREARDERDAALAKWHGHQKNVPCAGCPGGHDTFWLTVIKSPQWEKWFRHTDNFVVAECEACGHISQAHFQAFLAFVATAAALKEPS